MKKILLLVLTLTLVSGLFAQETERPELSKKEVRQYQRKLKKLNASLKKKTAKLEKFLRKQGADSLLPDQNPLGDLAMPEGEVPEIEMPDTLQGAGMSRLNTLKSQVPKGDTSQVRQRLRAEAEKLKEQAKSDNPEVAEKLDQLQQLKNRRPRIDTAGALSGVSKEIDLLKRKLKVSSELKGGDPDVKGKLQESVMELVDIEYDLKDLEELKSQMKGLKLDSAMVRKYLEPLNADVAAIQSQVGGYRSRLDGYKRELVDWDKTLEKEILKLEEMEGLREYVEKPPIDPAAQLKNAQRTIEQGYQSTEFVNKLIKERLEELLEKEGPDALAKRLTEGHEKLAEYKNKYRSLDDVTKAPKRPPNPLKGVPFKERLVFGGNLQVNRQKPLNLDAGLEIAYLLSQKAELGLGGAYRLKLEKGARPETVTDLFNMKSFYHHSLWRSIGIQGNYELNYALPRTEQAVEGLTRQWSQSGLLGLRNEQPFSKKLGGYVTLQYDFLHKASSPNPRWVFRFGFRLN